MIGWNDLQWWITDNDRSDRWPIWQPVAASMARGKQPDGSLTLVLRHDDWLIADSSFMTKHEPGALMCVEGYLRSFATTAPFQIARVSVIEMGSYLVITNEALWAELLRDRLVFDATTGSFDSLTGTADNVLREYWRLNMTAGANIPTNYPVAARTGFGGITVAVEADTSSHGTSPTYTVDSGKNCLDFTREFANKFDLRCTMAMSGAQITLGVATPYQGTDNSLATTGQLLTPGLGTLAEWKEVIDYSAVRNVWLVADGTNRTWDEDETSQANFGVREGMVKIQKAGAAADAAMRGYEGADQVATTKDPQIKYEIVATDRDWLEFGDDYTVSDLVTVAEYDKWSRDADLEVVNAEVSLSEGGIGTIKLTVGVPPRDYRYEAWTYYGPRGGRETGSRFAIGQFG